MGGDEAVGEWVEGEGQGGCLCACWRRAVDGVVPDILEEGKLGQLVLELWSNLKGNMSSNAVLSAV